MPKTRPLGRRQPPPEPAFGVVMFQFDCITILIPLAAGFCGRQGKGKLRDVTFIAFLVVAAEEIDLLHPALAVFGTQVPVQIHYL